MAKALVIKGANFSANALDHIVYEGIHAESITLSESVASFDTIGDTLQLTCSIVPSDAVDAVLWSSSDTDVATVNQTGLVTVVGCGTCTIAVSAGTVSDTCEIVVQIALAAQKFIRTQISAHTASSILTDCGTTLGSSSTSYSNTYSWCGAEKPFNNLMVAAGMAKKNTETGEYEMPDPSTYTTGSLRIYENIGYPIPILLPPNASKIVCTAPNNHYGVYPLFYNHAVRANDDKTSNGYFQPQRKPEQTTDGYTYTFSSEIEVDIPTGYDSVTLVWKSESSDYDFTNLTEQELAQFAAVCV